MAQRTPRRQAGTQAGEGGAVHDRRTVRCGPPMLRGPRRGWPWRDTGRRTRPILTCAMGRSVLVPGQGGAMPVWGLAVSVLLGVGQPAWESLLPGTAVSGRCAAVHRQGGCPTNHVHARQVPHQPCASALSGHPPRSCTTPDRVHPTPSGAPRPNQHKPIVRLKRSPILARRRQPTVTARRGGRPAKKGWRPTVTSHPYPAQPHPARSHRLGADRHGRYPPKWWFVVDRRLDQVW